MNTSRLAQWGEAAGFFVPEWIVFLGAAGFLDPYCPLPLAVPSHGSPAFSYDLGRRMTT
jgi:hypothetical protein